MRSDRQMWLKRAVPWYTYIGLEYTAGRRPHLSSVDILEIFNNHALL